MLRMYGKDDRLYIPHPATCKEKVCLQEQGNDGLPVMLLSRACACSSSAKHAVPIVAPVTNGASSECNAPVSALQEHVSKQAACGMVSTCMVDKYSLPFHQHIKIGLIIWKSRNSVKIVQILMGLYTFVSVFAVRFSTRP